MPIQNATYDELRAQTEALIGHDFRDRELTRFNQNINLAAKRAYRRSRIWPRFLVASEPRSVVRGIVSRSEDSFNVYGAGTQEVNGLYVRNGDTNSAPRYTRYAGDGTTELWDIEYDGSANWRILVGSGNSLTENTVYYTIASVATLPPESGWVSSSGDDPSPLLVDVLDIDTMIGVNLCVSSHGAIRGINPVPFDSDSRGYVIQGRGRDEPVVYCDYKRKFTEVYGDGTNGTTTAIPEEWLNYMALYAAYMFQFSERQGDASRYTIALSEVNAALEDELLAINAQQRSSSIGSRISTGTMMDRTLY